ncbi:MAG: flagellar export chaperone FliS [Deltaproteobacteria bacterium]|nr:flagellar export chaperone FliS [Deltaproteobacteria bacterium]
MKSKAFRQYKETSVLTASPLRLILLCYDGAITAIKTAQQAQAERKFELRDKEINRASALVGELLTALRDEGDQITANLKSLYLYILKMLLEASVKNDVELYHAPLKVLDELREAWQSLAEGRAVNFNGVKPEIMEQNAGGAAL